MADLDVTVKPIYGHQEGAVIGSFPHIPGRPSHAFLSVFLRTLRVALDVDVRSGYEHAAMHGLSNLWSLWDRLTPGQRPWVVCGDAGFGYERLLCECVARVQLFLYRLRCTTYDGHLVFQLVLRGGWQPMLDGWEGYEGLMLLTGWTCKRRTFVLRRYRPVSAVGLVYMPLFSGQVVVLVCGPVNVYVVLVTCLEEDLLCLMHLYRLRADVVNAYVVLKFQWGWGGFTTRELGRCQVAACMVAQV